MQNKWIVRCTEYGSGGEDWVYNEFSFDTKEEAEDLCIHMPYFTSTSHIVIEVPFDYENVFGH